MQPSTPVHRPVSSCLHSRGRRHGVLLDARLFVSETVAAGDEQGLGARALVHDQRGGKDPKMCARPDKSRLGPALWSKI